MEDTLVRLRAYAPLVLRAGLAAMYLWFGYQQIVSGSAWEVWVPEWALVGGITPATIVLFNGWFEVVFGMLLLTGYYQTAVAGLLAAHLFLIAFEIGLTAIGVRDFGLAMATLALALLYVPVRQK